MNAGIVFILAFFMSFIFIIINFVIIWIFLYLIPKYIIDIESNETILGVMFMILTPMFLLWHLLTMINDISGNIAIPILILSIAPLTVISLYAMEFGNRIYYKFNPE